MAEVTLHGVTYRSEEHPAVPVANIAFRVQSALRSAAPFLGGATVQQALGHFFASADPDETLDLFRDILALAEVKRGGAWGPIDIDRDFPGRLDDMIGVAALVIGVNLSEFFGRPVPETDPPGERNGPSEAKMKRVAPVLMTDTARGYYMRPVMAGLCSLADLKTVLTINDLADMHEVLNAREAHAAYARKQADMKKRKERR